MSVSVPAKKADVLRDYHGRGVSTTERPALNVKTYSVPEYTAAKIREHYGCSEAAAERAAENVYEAEREQFWEYDALELINHVMAGDRSSEWKPTGLKDGPYRVYGEGRSGGWLVVEGLPPVSEWDGAMFQKWRKYARLIRETMAWKLTWEAAESLIDANEWCPAEGSRAGTKRDALLADDRKMAVIAREIHEVMNGTEWGADTHEAVADCFERHGLKLADYEEGGDDE